MDIKDAIRSIIKPHDDDPITQLTTTFGESLSPDNILSEYPRPQFERKEYLNLNGYWDYAFCSSRQFPDHYMGKILVPFSPEASLSGVNRQLQPEEYLWYRRFLPISEYDLLHDNRLLLHFGAIDYEADIFINGQKVFSHKEATFLFPVTSPDIWMHQKTNWQSASVTPVTTAHKAVESRF